MKKKPKAGKKLPKKATSSDKEKKCAKKSIKRYKIYILKVLKQVKAMGIMNSFINDIFEKFARYKKKPIITSREIHTVGRLVLPGELVKHNIYEGTKTIIEFTS
ncbi:hypothetical protein AB3S75_037932 [Citrus x aurantiifolia]